MLLIARPCLSVAWIPPPHLGSSWLSKRCCLAGKRNTQYTLPHTNRLSGTAFARKEVATLQHSSSEKPLSENIREAYVAGETDGILDLSRALSFGTLSPEDLVAASVEAGARNKRKVSGILNAWIGACCLFVDPSFGAEWSWKLLLAFDEVSDSIGTYPDIVALSLVYTALSRAPQMNYSALAEVVLERAAKLSKKNGGSKRRRALAASRRQGPGVNAKDVEEELQKLCGSDFHVLHETDGFVVISKPSGMVCFHKRKTTAGKITSSRKRKNRQEGRKMTDISLEDAFLHHNIPLSTLNHEGRGIVHRIDRGTSGCIILAKTDSMHAKLVSEFFLRRVKKSYFAVVAAGEDLPVEGIVDIPVHGRPAKSSFSVIDHYGSAAVCLRVETLTGRKHQVRVHCAQGLGRPILMDPVYAEGKEGNNNPPQVISELATETQQRFFLHASSVCIPKYDVEVEAPLPCWWKEAVVLMESLER